MFSKSQGVFVVQTGDLVPAVKGMQVGVLRLTGLPNGFHKPEFELADQRWELLGNALYPDPQQSGMATIRVGFNTRFPTIEPTESPTTGSLIVFGRFYLSNWLFLAPTSNKQAHQQTYLQNLQQKVLHHIRPNFAQH